MPKLTQEEFIRRAVQVHGDKYDLSEAIYTGCRNDVSIICKKHGLFKITPVVFINHRGGCQKCAHEAIGNSMRGSLNTFIKDATNIHGNKYDYSLVVYKDNRTKVSIICPTHGVFMTTPSTHICGKHGCPKCGHAAQAKKKTKINTQIFIESATVLHKGKYTYENTVYTHTRNKVNITCPEHGSFLQRASAHLYGAGCPKCALSDASKRYRADNYYFIEKSKLIHGDRYDYSKVSYTRNNVKVIIICPEHGEFLQTPANHWKGKGCPKCKSSYGEKLIEEYLQNNSIPYIAEYKDHECIYKYRLSFDFAVFRDTDYSQLEALLEFDGKQHYSPIDFFGGESAYKEAVKRDATKNEYCLNNNIPLIRIPYYEIDNINVLLNEQLLPIRTNP